jgi:hypothetical protein
MAYNKELLDLTLNEMKQVFLADPNTAVRGQNFIKKIHEYCIQELIARGFSGDLTPKGEIKVLTSHKFKDVDVAVVHPTSGPLLVIGVRSQMSSLGKNFLNYYEMEVGDVSAIHERYPLCVVGLLYVHPTESILPGAARETFNFDRAEKMFKLISGRVKASDPHSHYEEIAYLRVNFHNEPPTSDDAFPTDKDLRIDDFFDKLYQRYVERNFPLLKD